MPYFFVELPIDSKNIDSYSAVSLEGGPPIRFDGSTEKFSKFRGNVQIPVEYIRSYEFYRPFLPWGSDFFLGSVLL